MHFGWTNNFSFGGVLKKHVLFCKFTLSKMTSTKTNKNKKWTPLPKTNFLSYTTLLLGPKRFVHSKGPKIAFCLC